MAIRKVLPNDKLDPSIANTVANYHAAVVKEVEDAVQRHPVVVVGMGINPLVKKACKALEREGIPFHFITHGSYFSKWRERLAIKLWSGWPTFPQVFVKGVLIGGCTDLEKLLAAKEVQKRVGK
jgi:monothiol glutaredoxin